MNEEEKIIRLPFKEIENHLYGITVSLGFEDADARLIAHTHTQSSCDGVSSHGLNRFPRFVEYVQKGYILPGEQAKRTGEFGSWEQWDGHQGAGIPNASVAIDRAISLARANGMGGVALRNTNHWMRAGTYGWKAAEENCIAICMTNTIPNMPPWGGVKKTIGNNPIMLAVPRKKGPVVIDMATSQFSYGRLEDAKRRGEALPFPGGWNHDGALTDDPDAILQSGRILPAGYWKGSGLSIIIDLLVSLLSNGLASHQIGTKKYETGLSQLFLCIDVEHANTGAAYQNAADAIIESIHNPVNEGETGPVYYPGERTLLHRRQNIENGVPVDAGVWRLINSFSIH